MAVPMDLVFRFGMGKQGNVKAEKTHWSLPIFPEMEKKATRATYRLKLLILLPMRMRLRLIILRVFQR